MYQLDFLWHHFVWLLLLGISRPTPITMASQKLSIEFPVINLSWAIKMIYKTTVWIGKIQEAAFT